MRKHRLQAGFTAVELLITLFVAAAFLIASYQLFNVVIKDGGNARAQSRAANVAYDYMRRYSTSATIPCSAQTPLTNSSTTADGLTNTKVTVALSCPAFSTTDITKVDVTVTYNTPTQTVKYSTFVNGSGVASSDITNGLVGWWKLNGNTDTAVGSNNATNVNATPTVGQNGQANTGYLFDGSTTWLNFGNASVFNSTEVTLSAWIKPANTTGTLQIIGKELQYKTALSGTGGIYVLVGSIGTGWTTNVIYPAPAIVAGSWAFVAMTVSSSAGTAKIYVNGSMLGSTSMSPITAFNSNPLLGGAYTQTPGNSQFNGTLDDLRIYNRALSATEISTLYTNGAQ
jgi:Tfp pilus assembly protein PilV